MNNNEARNEFEKYLKRRHGDRSTVKHYMSDLKIFLETLNQKAYDQLDGRDVERFIEQQQKRGLSAATINRRLASMSTFFEVMASLEPETEQVNPVFWRFHGVKETERIARDASDAEVTALFEQVTSPRDHAMFGLMVGAGLRVGEVASLTMDALRPPSESGGLAPLRLLGKGQKERVVWLTPHWYEKVVAYQAVRPDSEDPHIFLNGRKQGIAVSGIQYRFRICCQRAGLTLTCHQLRHTFSRRVTNQGMPIESLSKVLGHSQIETTRRYTAGADPVLQAEFEAAMTQLETADDASSPHAPPQPPRPARQHHPADMADLNDALARFSDFPEWLRPAHEAYLTHCWHQWKPHMAAHNAHATARQLVPIWEWLTQTFDLKGWDSLRRTHIEAWMDDCLNRGLKASTVVRYRTHLVSVLLFAQDRNLAEFHPQILRTQSPSVPDTLPRFLKDDEYKRLLQTVLDYTENQPEGLLHRTWFLTLTFTGIRLSELLNLRLSDLDLPTGRLLIEQSKNDKSRVAFLTSSLCQHLQHYLAQRPASDSDHLFVGENGLPLSPGSVRYRCRRWGEACDVQVSPHRLRHTFATRLINHGVSIESIRRLLGHRTLHMTQRYARLYESTVRRHFEEATAHIDGILIQDWPQQEESYVNVTTEPVANSM